MPWWNAKNTRSRVKPKGFVGGWNKGLTKLEDARVMAMYTERRHPKPTKKLRPRMSVEQRNKKSQVMQVFFASLPFEVECLFCGKEFWSRSPITTKCPSCLRPRKCLCGCGKLTTYGGHRYLHGHNGKGLGSRPNTSETLKRAYREGRVKPHSYKVVRRSKFELALATELAKRGLCFDCQRRIPETRFFVDFFIPKENLIVEVVGHQSHYIDPDRIKLDKRRERVLRSLGYRQLYFKWNQLAKGVQYCADRVVQVSEKWT